MGSASTAPQTTITATTQTAQQPVIAALDTADVATLNDALGSAGIDLRAEEETLRQSAASTQGQTHASQSRGTQRNRARKQGTKVVFDAAHLGMKMRKIAVRHGLQTGAVNGLGVPEDAVSYLALALHARLAKLTEGMIAAATHREETDATRTPGLYEDGSPMWSVVVRKDIAKQIEVLEKVEKDEEFQARRERKVQEANISSQAALPSLDGALQMEQEEEPKPQKKKKKAESAADIIAKNQNIEAKKMNAAANAAAGLNKATSKYSWMNTGNVSTGQSVKKPGGKTTSATPTTWTKYQPPKKKDDTPAVEEDARRVVTMKDAVFLIERERGHGGGRGAARHWT
ncbi:hypothetical protein M422DRAFT_60647 [Sphaerobolus stellatus SS14]|uniref:Transcription initiation factor TFIID subunit 4 n=1 Tax=Sphaerobolus stellatus (strain SS14) TaxID=990650 RepID=A0A0C9U9W5_SPHS4|nr:hypothetical protein M422DRAFT_60647 [Sphaerobolus stellatus SS14]